LDEGLEPSARGGPPTLAGIEEVLLVGGGAEESVRPGCEKGSGEDSLPQRLPIARIEEFVVLEK
jgi:hypothetical protein